MPRRKKHAVRKGHGSMCNICGKNCGRGGALKKHTEGSHNISYDDYLACFYNGAKNIYADTWNDEVKTSKGENVLIHTIVRRFIGYPGKRGVTKNVPQKK